MNKPDNQADGRTPRAVLRYLIESTFRGDEVKVILSALDLAAEIHANQRRDDGSPYIDHPVRVAIIVIEKLGRRDIRSVCTALLHDVIEDSEVDAQMLRLRLIALFGPEIASGVQTLTKPPRGRMSREEINVEYFARLRIAPDWIKIIKLADRLDNLRDLVNSPNPEKRARMLLETNTFFIPLIETLGDKIVVGLLGTAFASAIEGLS